MKMTQGVAPAMVGIVDRSHGEVDHLQAEGGIAPKATGILPTLAQLGEAAMLAGVHVKAVFIVNARPTERFPPGMIVAVYLQAEVEVHRYGPPGTADR